MGGPCTFFKDYKKFVDDVQAALERVHVPLDKLEGTMLMGIGVPMEAEDEFVSIELTCCSDKKQALIVKEKVQYVDSDTSDSHSDRRCAHSTSDSSDPHNGQKNSRATNSKPTYTSRVVFPSLERGGSHLALKDLKPMSLFHRNLSPYRYYRLHDSSCTRYA